MSGDIADQLTAALAPYEGPAWLRTSVEVFRPVSSPDGHGGSAVTVGATATLTVAADPVAQQSGQVLIVRKDAEVRVGDLIQIEHSQFRSD